MFEILGAFLLFKAFEDFICLFGLIVLCITVIASVAFLLFYFWPAMLLIAVIYLSLKHSKKDEKIANQLRKDRQAKRAV
jgi:hypothetical protein